MRAKGVVLAGALALAMGCPERTTVAPLDSPVYTNVLLAKEDEVFRSGKGLDASGEQVRLAALRPEGSVVVRTQARGKVGAPADLAVFVHAPRTAGEVFTTTVRGEARGPFDEPLAAFGYKPKTVEEGLAVVLAELDDDDFNGIGIACVPDHYSVCVAHHKWPVVTFSLDNVVERDTIHEVVQALAEKCLANKSLLGFGKAVHVVLGGEVASKEGRCGRFKDELSKVKLPFAVSQPSVAKSAESALARGALVAARADKDNQGD
jgi:hypothetical protein